jgi:hypothetical protein
MNEVNPCPICGLDSKIQNLGGGPNVECLRCGKFKVNDMAEGSLTSWPLPQKANLSGWVRENPNVTLSSDLLTSLANLRSPSVGEKADKLLLFLSHTHPKPGQRIRFNTQTAFDTIPYDKALYAVCWCQDQEEFLYILHGYLRDEKKFLNTDHRPHAAGYIITPSGWSHLHSSTKGNSNSQIGFIAMWFDDSVNGAWTAIAQGVRAARYDPLRIDKKEHNNKIDDEIIAGIRRSKFLVADFTGHRGGVYFESGLAIGLGLPVIWLCRNDELEKTHFDTRQYNFIVWKGDKLTELSNDLQNRIEATIGRGSF